MAKSTRRRRSKRSPIQTILGTIGAILLAAFLFVMQTLFPGLFPSPGGSNPGGNPGATQPPVVETNANWLTVYFTTPNPPDAATSAVETEVINAINGATTSIDAASFDFNLPKMTQALVAAKQRGVRVRVVMDEEEGRYVVSDSAPAGIEGYDALAALRRANVEIVNGGRSNGIMHNKILIIDNRVMYIGSWNFSYNDTFRNDNNILKITAQRIIENYRGKFDEMFSLRQFGTRARVGARNPNMTINGINVENYFRSEWREKLHQDPGIHLHAPGSSCRDADTSTGRGARRGCIRESWRIAGSVQHAVLCGRGGAQRQQQVHHAP
jgi:phosphatidylserine/phosphatidylglycerophosphate/cardiolipin synthase-like enzyme